MPAQETNRETDNIAAPSWAKAMNSKNPMQENKNTARTNLKQNLGFDTGAGELLNNDFQSCFNSLRFPLILRRSTTNARVPTTTHASTDPSHKR